ncbi:hypothetical protein [Klebsiella oxytoca]|uniref:hypothetical protein n=1 Tax=Klebsiella oxytoca TaxID=571 RepID=UPI001CCC129F|nr:hypothetical protein [Klebsiella oxytoca]
MRFTKPLDEKLNELELRSFAVKPIYAGAGKTAKFIAVLWGGFFFGKTGVLPNAGE